MGAYTKEEKKAYFAELRAKWNHAKEMSNIERLKIEAIIANHGMNISATGYAFVAEQMAAQSLDGVPYIDAKTFNGWKENGFIVKKGEKSSLSGITWIKISKEEKSGEVDEFSIPKAYHLFHRSQVQPLN